MNLFQELLTLGQHLHEPERLALYKFLTATKKAHYKTDALELIEYKELKSHIANGEIIYSLKGNLVSYSARKNGTIDYHENIRQLKLSRIKHFRIRKLMKFFAQCEVEVIWNYPLQSENTQVEGSYCIISYPFYDLNYYSNGKGKILGFIKKLKTNDSEVLAKLAS